MVYVAMEPNEDSAKFRLGLICCATTLLFCAAPLASLVRHQYFALKAENTKSFSLNREMFLGREVPRPYHSILSLPTL